MPSRIVIVGAGISGLSLAYRLHQKLPTAAITLLEQNSRAGGVVWTERLHGFQVENGPNGFLDTKPSTLNLCNELGLHDQLVAANPENSRNRFLFLDGKLQALPNSPLSFLRSPLLSWRGKLAFLSERFRRRRRDLPLRGHAPPPIACRSSAEASSIGRSRLQPAR